MKLSQSQKRAVRQTAARLGYNQAAIDAWEKWARKQDPRAARRTLIALTDKKGV